LGGVDLHGELLLEILDGLLVAVQNGFQLDGVDLLLLFQKANSLFRLNFSRFKGLIAILRLSEGSFGLLCRPYLQVELLLKFRKGFLVRFDGVL